MNYHSLLQFLEFITVFVLIAAVIQFLRGRLGLRDTIVLFIVCIWVVVGLQREKLVVLEDWGFEEPPQEAAY
jgi:hypothetical protein